jgi:diguanylate cyclase (GGDEF)-like protein
MWIATAGGGVNHVVDGTIHAIRKEQGMATNETAGLMQDRDGAIWVATYTAGVSRIRLDSVEGNRVQPRYRIDNFDASKGLPNVDARVLMQDRDGTIWAGTVGGLARFDVAAQSFLAVTGAEALQEGVVAMLQDRRGALWFGTPGKGLVRYTKNNGEAKWETFTRKEGLVSNWILALYEDASGAIWVGTNGEGMNRIKDGRVAPIRVSDGLWDGTVQVLIEDKAGRMWMTCNRGFSYVMRNELDDLADGRVKRVTTTRFGPTDGLRSNIFASAQQPAGALDPTGQLWLPTLRGLVLVDTHKLPDSGGPPKVNLDDVLIDGKSSDTSATIVLPPGSLPLTIRYSASTLLHADRARFRYRLVGIHRDWVDASNSGRGREVTFPSLPAGKYQFVVATTLDGKVWRDAEVPLSIVVKPHFYQTAWFGALAAFGLLVAAIVFVRWRTWQLHLRQQKMKRVIAEKTEELRLANEHLSQLSLSDPLTGLANRRHLDAMLETEWRRAARSKMPLAVVIADVDAFKAYNDTLGHPEGDKCLVMVASVIRDATNRAGDLAARYGGEEFIIIVPGLARDAALEYAEMLRSAVEARAIPHPSSPVSSVITMSIGVAACVPSEESSAAALIAEADAALYRAKNEGRNRVR